MLSTSSPGPDAALPRRWRRLRKAASVAMGLALLAWGLLLCAWLALHWVILPHIDEWRPALERHAGKAIGLKLRIGEIRVRSGGWVPAFELRDVRLYDEDDRVALQLERVHTALAPQALLSLTLRFEQILIDGARLEVRRDVAGRLHVAGLDWAGGSLDGEDTRARDWFLEQREFVLRNGELRWIDERSGAPPLELTRLDLIVRNGLRRHDLRLDATPPAHWGRRFTLRGRFTQPMLADAGEVRQWSGTLYAELPQADLAEMRRHIDLPFELSRGEGALRTWLDIRQGAPLQATLDVALRSVSMRLDPDLPTLAIAVLGGRVEAARDADGVSLKLRNLKLEQEDAPASPAGELRLALRQKQDLRSTLPSDAPVTGGEFSADRLDLALLAHTAARLPLGEPAHRLIAAVAPRGQVHALQASWSAGGAAPPKYQVNARLADVSLEPAVPPPDAADSPVRPGVRGAQLEFSASEAGGKATLRMQRGTLILPGVWAQPDMALDELDAALSWRLEPEAGRPPSIALKVERARFANTDMQGEFSADWHTGVGEGSARGTRFPGRIDLNGKLVRGHADRVARYLPLGLPQAARDYAGRAIRGGTITAAGFKVKGDVWDFPFRTPGEGELRIGMRVQDLVFDALPGSAHERGWPAFEQVGGEIEFDRLSMALRGVGARLWGYELSDVHGGIADLAAARPTLAVEGRGRGPATDVLRYLRNTPLAAWIGPAVEPISIAGPSELQLALDIPMVQPGQVGVRGSLQLPGNDMRIRPDLPPLAAARGRIEFTHQGFALRSATASVLGGEAAFEGGLAPDGALRVSAQGTASAEGLRTLPQLTGVARVLQGQAAYRASFALLQGGFAEFGVSSNLAGMRIDLPAPLDKPADAAWPLKLQTALVPDSLGGGGVRARDNLLLEIGDVLEARYLRDISGAEPRVLRGSVAVRDVLPAPTATVAASLKLGRVDVDAWMLALDRLGVDAAGDGADSGYLPQTLRLRADELRSGAQRISRLDASVQRQGLPAETVWRADVSAEQLDGRLEFHMPRTSDQAGRLMARLQRVSLPPSDVAGVEELLSRPPSSIPALDIVVEDFELRGKKLGRLEVEAHNRVLPGRAGTREWQLTRLNLTVPEAKLEASGRWSAGGLRRMALDFKLALADSGAYLDRLGIRDALRGGKGQLQGQLNWSGSPLTMDYPSLEGTLRLDIDAGQFLNADPGGARLLSVLSLSALPRRLTLDFRDLFQEGFAFDSIAGDVTVARGVAETSNLSMRGVQAVVLMRGSADLMRETQDLRVLIVPNIDATGAALATMAINPAIGLGTLVAQWVLREPLRAAGTREFHITGPWADANVQRIEHVADAAAGEPPPGNNVQGGRVPR